jgi:hypothetical protein
VAVAVAVAAAKTHLQHVTVTEVVKPLLAGMQSLTAAAADALQRTKKAGAAAVVAEAAARQNR